MSNAPTPSTVDSTVERAVVHPQHGAVDVVVTWGNTPIAVERLAHGETFTVGGGAAADRHFVCEHASIPLPRFPLVENGPSGVRLRASGDMTLLVDGKKLDVADITLAKRSKASVRVGPLEFSVGVDRRAATALDSLKDIVDTRLLRLSGIALALHAGFVMMMLLAQAPIDLDLASLRDRMPPRLVQTVMTPPKPAAATTKEKKAKVEPKNAAIARASAHAKPHSRASAKDLAKDAIATIFGSHTGSTSDVFGAGIDASLAGLHGGNIAAGGSEGFSTRPTGGGGDGKGVTIGDLGGHGPKCDDCADMLANTATKKHIDVKVEKGPIFEGGLQREEIQRVISRVMNQIKYCYEKELNHDPALEGKLVMGWTIAGDGSVVTASVAQDTFSAPGGKQVGGCVTRIIQRLKFPMPRGGGQVVVTYPYVFSSSGS